MKNGRFFFLFLFLSSCMMYILPEDLPRLKGTWDGWYVVRNLHYRSALNIYNEWLPLRGSLMMEGSPGEKPVFYAFENGYIDDRGRLIVRLNHETVLDLALIRKYAEFKLDGIFSSGEQSGRIALLKVG